MKRCCLGALKKPATRFIFGMRCSPYVRTTAALTQNCCRSQRFFEVPLAARQRDFTRLSTAITPRTKRPSHFPSQLPRWEFVKPSQTRVECWQRGCSSMVEQKLPKLTTRVRFPSPAPINTRYVFGFNPKLPNLYQLQLSFLYASGVDILRELKLCLGRLSFCLHTARY